MLDLTAYIWLGTALLGIGGCLWLVSIAKRDVSIVDAAWSLMFLAIVCIYAATTASAGMRTALVLVLVTIWALRLSAHIAWRNHGKLEDQRYQAIRRNNEPGFWFKSLYIVFGLQALFAWIIATPLAVAISGTSTIGLLDVAGIVLWLVGFGFESIGDWQLARFKRNPFNRGKVLDSGLWAYTRHPNYFGECLLWWGFYLIALSAGGWWTLFAPVLMTVLLLKVSGVALLEKDIADRRPAYADYIRRTNAFLPGPRHAPIAKEKHA
jgi:steroid 5-alpha reductase family enzyme